MSWLANLMRDKTKRKCMLMAMTKITVVKMTKMIITMMTKMVRMTQQMSQNLTSFLCG